MPALRETITVHAQTVDETTGRRTGWSDTGRVHGAALVRIAARGLVEEDFALALAETQLFDVRDQGKKTAQVGDRITHRDTVFTVVGNLPTPGQRPGSFRRLTCRLLQT